MVTNSEHIIWPGFKSTYLSLFIVRDIHQSATALKPMKTDEVYAIDHGYSIVFQWKTLAPAVHVDVL